MRACSYITSRPRKCLPPISYATHFIQIQHFLNNFIQISSTQHRAQFLLCLYLLKGHQMDLVNFISKKIDQIYWLVNYIDVFEMLLQKSF